MFFNFIIKTVDTLVVVATTITILLATYLFGVFGFFFSFISCCVFVSMWAAISMMYEHQKEHTVLLKNILEKIPVDKEDNSH